MPCVNFRATRPHEPPRAKRKCRVILRNSRSRSSSHSENDAEYIMGLRKSGASREYDSIDVRFTSTLCAMALALRQQRMRERDRMSGNEEVRALAESLAGGMRIKVEEEDEEDEEETGSQLSAISELPESGQTDTATDVMQDEILWPDSTNTGTVWLNVPLFGRQEAQAVDPRLDALHLLAQAAAVSTPLDHLSSYSLLVKCTNNKSYSDQEFECLLPGDDDHNTMCRTWAQTASHIQNSHPEYILSMPRPVKKLCPYCGNLDPDFFASMHLLKFYSERAGNIYMRPS